MLRIPLSIILFILIIGCGQNQTESEHVKNLEEENRSLKRELNDLRTGVKML
jgi:hypothetical protein